MSIKRLPWLRMLRKSDPEAPLRLPLVCGPMSNGEAWWPDSPRKKLIRKLVNDKAEEVSRHHNIDRREFMASACGMATTLYMINLVNGCGGDKTGVGGAGAGGTGVGGAGAGGAGAGAGAGAGGAGAGGAAGMMNSTAVPGGMSGTTSGAGGFNVPNAGGIDDPDVCGESAMMGRGELIIDMQSHFAAPETNPLGALGLASFVGQITPARFPWIVRSPGVTGAAAFDRTEYINQIYMGSDTTIGVLSGISYALGADGMGVGGFAALSNEDLIGGATFLRSQFPGRMLTHCMVMPNDRIEVQLAMMERNAGTYDNWKTYPPWGPGTGPQPDGYWLNEGVGPQMFEKGLALGAPIFCIHKGFPLSSFSPTYTNPKDVGPAARLFPDAYLVIYHSAFEHGLGAGQSTEPSAPPTADTYCAAAMQRANGMFPEGSYSETDEYGEAAMYPIDRGVNSLIKSLRDANIGPNGTDLDNPTGPVTTHVYAECGGTWMNLMTGRHTEAMHYWGKLLKHVGEDNIVWGTDCLWFGSPQPGIMAFRCMEISQEFQDKYGYPALTQAVKEKILGQNTAKLQRIRAGVTIGACHADHVSAADLKFKRELDEEFGPRRDMMANVWAPRTRREFLMLHEQEEQEKRFWSGRIPAGKI